MSYGQPSRKVAIIGSNRIAFARNNTAYTMSSNQDMMTAALKGLVERYKLQGELIGEVAGGAVLKHSRDFNLIRESVLNTSLDPRTPAVDLQQACNTGMESAVYIANKIALGHCQSGAIGFWRKTSSDISRCSQGKDHRRSYQTISQDTPKRFCTCGSRQYGTTHGPCYGRPHRVQCQIL